jgi:hypothetical protein
MSFCVNSSHQAIALLSGTNMLSLYNVATLNRVWHRQLPTASPSYPPSSIQFCEANILVGRGDNTIFELVQITVDLAVLSSIKLTFPPPSPAQVNFTQAVYDTQKSVLWVCVPARGSLYGFKYALKGKPPMQVSKGEKAVAFSRMAEYPLETVLSLVLGPKPGHATDVEMFFGTPNGFSLAVVSGEAVEALNKPLEAPTVERTQAEIPAETPAQAETPMLQQQAPVTAPSSKVSVKTEQTDSGKKIKSTPNAKQAAKLASPAGIKVELSPDVETDVNASHAPAPAQRKDVQTPGIDEFGKVLKKVGSTSWFSCLLRAVAPVNGRNC